MKLTASLLLIIKNCVKFNLPNNPIFIYNARMKKSTVILIIIGFAAIAGAAYWMNSRQTGGEEESKNILVSEPKENDEIGLPFRIKGEARVFENTFNYRLKDGNDAILNENFSTALSPDIGQFGPFEIVVSSYSKPQTERGTLEVFSYSAKDGSEINKVSVPVKFKKENSMMVQVFFSKSSLNSNTEDCATVYRAQRRVAKSATVAKAALEELLAGPALNERQAGFITSINSGVKIQNLTIENGVAKADFDDKLNFQVGGSCRVAAIRSQIENTLKQFSTVKNVVISINGRTEDILQP